MLQSLSSAFSAFVNSADSVKDKIINSGGFFVGAAGATIQFAIPEFISNDDWTFSHTMILFVLMGIFFFEFIIGSKLANKGIGKSSGAMNDAFIRDSFIVFICVSAYFMGVAFGIHSYIYTFSTLAFIWANLYSLLANCVVLGWGKNFPMWLFNWLEDEIKTKFEKYYPDKDSQEFIESYKNKKEVI